MDGRLDLTRARREAKARLAAMRADDPAAKLSDAQLAIAREWGERSWPALVRRAAREQLEAAVAVHDSDRLRAALEAGADPQRTYALATALEREDRDTVRLVLDRLPEHSGERAWSLLWAVQHERSEEMLRLLVARGADLEAYDEANDRRPYGLAIRRGRRDLAELLASLGAQRRVGPVDELLGACRAGDAREARRLAAERPEALALLRGAYAGALAEAAGEERAQTVRILLDLGVPPDARAESGLTPLQAAAGSAEIEALLLAHGADPAKPGTPPVVATSSLDFAELSWEAEVAYLRLLTAAPNARTRPVGDGFAVRTGAHSNTENGVVCDRATEAEIAETIAWLGGAPAQWFISGASALGPRLVAAGATPERTSVVMGRPLESPPAEVGGAEVVPARGAAALAPFYDEPRHLEVLASLGAEGAVQFRVALRDGRPAGVAAWMVHGATLYGLNLEVAAPMRRQGIGAALLRRALREGHAAGARAAVLAPTPETIAFYRLFGFELRPYVQERSFYLP
jgi:GNAT superfamily N-acetyltransferase